jgi:hypothetical protein
VFSDRLPIEYRYGVRFPEPPPPTCRECDAEFDPEDPDDNTYRDAHHYPERYEEQKGLPGRLRREIQYLLEVSDRHER